MPMIPALLLIVSAIAYRIVTTVSAEPGSIGLLNFAPLAAIALCAAVYLPGKYKFAVPMLAMLVSDVVLNMHYGFSLLSPFVLSHYVAFGIIGCLGLLLQRRASWKTLLPASLGASVIFYVVTNSVSWLFDPAYPKNFGGFIQAQTIGHPAFAATPAWMFFRNTAVSDLLFTALFVGCMHLGRSTARSRASEPLPRPA